MLYDNLKHVWRNQLILRNSLECIMMTPWPPSKCLGIMLPFGFNYEEDLLKPVCSPALLENYILAFGLGCTYIYICMYVFTSAYLSILIHMRALLHVCWNPIKLFT